MGPDRATRIDYSELGGSPKDPSATLPHRVGEAPSLPAASDKATERARRSRSLLRTPFRLVKWAAAIVVIPTLPFVLLVRGGVLAYQEWGLGTWAALAASGGATMLLLALYAWAASVRLGAGKGVQKLFTRLAALVGAVYVVYSLVFVAGANIKTPELRNEYASLHPLLRVAASALFLVDREAVITDASRTPEFYRSVGLPPNESSLHFRQADGFVHALDLRTRGRPEWRNQTVAAGFEAMGFRVLRHVGTADHLHVSLPLPPETD